MKKVSWLVLSLALASVSQNAWSRRKDGPKPADGVAPPDFKGVFLGTFFVVPIKVEAARALLPDELELAPQNLVAPGYHPAVIIPGFQRDVHYYFTKAEMPLRYDYTESIVALPFTQFKEEGAAKAAGPYYYIPHIYLDNIVPLLLGKYYGLNKEIRNFSTTDRVYRIFDKKTGDVLLTAETPADVDVSQFVEPKSLANWEKVRALIEQPMLGRRESGKFVCTLYNWAGQKDFLVHPVAAKLDITASLGILPKQTIETKGLAEEELGAFDFISKWSASGPYDCATLGSKAPQKLVD